MLPATRNLTLVRGDDWGMNVTAEDSDHELVDLTGWIARAQIRKRAADAAVMLDIPTMITGSVVTLWITSDESATLKSNGVWDLELTAPDGVVQTVLAGDVTVKLDVTRDATP